MPKNLHLFTNVRACDAKKNVVARLNDFTIDVSPRLGLYAQALLYVQQLPGRENTPVILFSHIPVDENGEPRKNFEEIRVTRRTIAMRARLADHLTLPE